MFLLPNLVRVRQVDSTTVVAGYSDMLLCSRDHDDAPPDIDRVPHLPHDDKV